MNNELRVAATQHGDVTNEVMTRRCIPQFIIIFTSSRFTKFTNSYFHPHCTLKYFICYYEKFQLLYQIKYWRLK